MRRETIKRELENIPVVDTCLERDSMLHYENGMIVRHSFSQLKYIIRKRN